ncbi:MAG: DGQHR domain-containing protein [Erythrobacter sp.]
MSNDALGPIIADDDIGIELRQRRQKDIFRTVTGSTKKLIAEKVALEEQDGWRVAKRNKKSTRIAKPKPADEQLEDEVWCLLAQMGFKEMNRGRQFTIAVEDGLNPRQIDVFAKDDETVVIVECRQKATPGRKNMSDLIEKIGAIRGAAHKSIKAFYGSQKKLKVKFAIATRNILWGDADLEKCKEHQIAVMSDTLIDYYKQLTQHLKSAARFQFLAQMFEGQKVDGLAQAVVATRGKMGGKPFYTFLIKPEELMKIAYVGHKGSRDIENLETYQRMLQPNRLKGIAKYINDGGKFPTNIVINLKIPGKKEPHFEKKENIGEEVLGILHLPALYASAWIIDGQHRLYGYAYAKEKGGFTNDESVLPVLAYANLPADEEMDLFIDINSKQVKVKTGLLVELYADLHWKSDDIDEAFQALLSRIAYRLNKDKGSPLNDRMVISGTRKTSFRCLTQTSIRDGLKVAKLLGNPLKGTIVPGPLSTANPTDYDGNLKKSLAVLTDCLSLFSEKLPNQWEAGDSPTGYVCTNNGLRAIFHVIQDVAEHVKSTSGVDLSLLNADEAFRELSPFLSALAEKFASASASDVQAFRRIGSSLTAVKQQSFGMEAYVQSKIPEFKPLGLQEYLASRDEAGTDEAAGKVTQIHKKLFSYVIGTLKDHFGTQNKAWWTQGVPLAIRLSCTQEWEKKNREGEEESHLYLINYQDISIANWDLFRDTISLGNKDKDNKKESTKWIKRLNDIRQFTAHPEKGLLDKGQVEFVNETYDKVEEFIPNG